MNEVEKMYRNAGLSNMWVERYNDGYYEHEKYYNSYKEMINNMMKVNDWSKTTAVEIAKKECKKELPSFTDIKQFKLIKYLYTIRTFQCYQNQIVRDWHIMGEYFHISSNTFESCLARYVNYIWEYLTNAEKAQIKEILE